MNKISFILTCLLFVCSCKTVNYKRTASEYPTITISEDDFDKNKDFARVFEGINLIPLETTRKSIIGSVHSIKEYKGRYYVLDKDVGNSIIIFEEDGRFVNKISDGGKGPGEFIELNYLTIDEYSDHLIVCAKSPMKLLRYSLSGKYIDEVILDRTPYAVEAIDEKKYVIKYGGPADNICLISKKGDFIKVLYQLEDHASKSMLFKELIKQGERILYHQNYNDTIFLISENGMTPWLYVDFGERKITREMVDKIYSVTMQKQRATGPPRNIMTGSYYYTESDEMIYFGFTADFHGNSALHHVYHNKVLGSTIVIPPGRGADLHLFDKYRFLYWLLVYDVNSGGQAIACLDYSRLSNSYDEIEQLIKDGFISVKGESSITKLKNLDENSNPILVLCNIKLSVN